MVAELSAELATQLQQATELLQSAKRICILTGAGISAESGIPTFRDKQTGLWQNFRAEDLANPNAFERDPKLVWSWYQWRRQSVQAKLPNPAHQALAEWQQKNVTSSSPISSLSTDMIPSNQQMITLITQNVDDLHEQAGSDVIHLHGHLWRNRCHRCDMVYEAADNDSAATFSDELVPCKHCDGYIRPDIVWFGESLPVEAWQNAEIAAANCDVFMSIGTSSLVYPAAGLAQLANRNGAKVIEINPDPTPSSIVDITLAAKAGLIMPLLVANIRR